MRLGNEDTNSKERGEDGETESEREGGCLTCLLSSVEFCVTS